MGGGIIGNLPVDPAKTPSLSPLLLRGTTWQIRVSRIVYNLLLPESSFPISVFFEARGKVLFAKVRPEFRVEYPFGVSSLPWEEVACAVFPACPNY